MTFSDALWMVFFANQWNIIKHPQTWVAGLCWHQKDIFKQQQIQLFYRKVDILQKSTSQNISLS